MSGALSSAAEWSTLLEPVRPATDLPRRPDDPRLGEIIECWQGDATALRPGLAALLGFPQDEGVRRNGGRVGGAEAPREIRRWLHRLTPWDGASGVDLAADPPLDLGDLRITGNLEQTQADLGRVVAELLKRGLVPVVLGGGHETAYAHFLGYVGANRPVAAINIDAHLDVRPLLDDRGHSGSPFRQMLEHPTHPLAGYACVGAQPGCVARSHQEFVERRGGTICWNGGCGQLLFEHVMSQVLRFSRAGQSVYASMDADAFRAADVPGVSAPNPLGIPGEEARACARHLGQSPAVSSFDLVEINPRFDRDGQSARWAALVIWNFLIGFAQRRTGS